MSLQSSTAEKKQVPSKGFWGQVWVGAVTPSFAGLVGMCLVAAGLLGVCVWWATPERLTRLDHRYFMTVHLDDYTVVSFAAMRAAVEGPKPFAVALFGDSSFNAAMPDTETMEQALTDALGQPAPVHSLAAKGMNFIEAAGVMDYIGEGFNGIVVIQMDMFHLSQTPHQQAILLDAPRLAIDTPVYDEELSRVAGRRPWRTGVYLLDHWKFYAYRLNEHAVKNILLGPTPLPLGRRPMSAEQWRTADHNVRAFAKEHLSQRDRNASIINRMVQRLRDRGRVEIVILETPTNPRRRRLISDELFEDHQRHLKDWIASQGLHYWDLQDEAALEAEDFYDYVHVSSPQGQRRFSEALAGRVSELAKQWRAQESQP